MNCTEIDFGTYNCAYNVMLPYLVNDGTGKMKSKTVAVDKCLLPEILRLWEEGIKTTGCCCGHGRNDPFIGVKQEYIPQMKSLGYSVAHNPCRPDDEDSFVPKTKIQYGSADKGFNWWDEVEH